MRIIIPGPLIVLNTNYTCLPTVCSYIIRINITLWLDSSPAAYSSTLAVSTTTDYVSLDVTTTDATSKELTESSSNVATKNPTSSSAASNGTSITDAPSSHYDIKSIILIVLVLLGVMLVLLLPGAIYACVRVIMLIYKFEQE